MSWSDAFRAKLQERTFAPIWAIEVLIVGAVPSNGGAWFCSHNAQVVTGSKAWIAQRGIHIQGQRLSMASWTCSIGAFTVEMVGDRASVLARVTRGTWLRVWMGFAGWGLEDYQPITMGAVKNIRGHKDGISIECWDWKSALQSRQDVATPQLFAGIGSTTTLNGAYAGTTSPMTVVDTTGFERESSGSGAVRLESSLGDACYYLWTATTATTFTITTSVVKFATDGTVGGANGDTVTEVAYLNGTPWDIVRKLLTSTGTASANGPYDLYPASWGWNVPNALIDHDAMDLRELAFPPASGAYTLDIVVNEKQDNGIGWLEEWLTPLGMFLVTRQGMISMEVVRSSGSLLADEREVTDADILIGPGHDYEWEAWDSDYTEECRNFVFNTVRHDGTEENSVSVGDTPATLPASESNERRIDVSGSVRDNTQADLILDEIRNRLGVTKTRIPERLTIWLTLKFAVLCPGELVLLTTTRADGSPARVYGREETSVLGYVSRHAIVLEITPDWHGAAVKASFAIFPTQEDAWVP